MANTSACIAVTCVRCQGCGHVAKDCHLPFYRASLAERRVEAARKKAEWEARQAEKEKKHQEWEARQVEKEKKHQEWLAKQKTYEEGKKLRPSRIARSKDVDVESNASDTSTAASATRAVFDEADVERIAMMDKDVRKFAKLLRDIENLENRSSLDAMQKAKIERKSEAELHFSTARDRAMIRAREELRQRFPGSFDA